MTDKKPAWFSFTFHELFARGACAEAIIHLYLLVCLREPLSTVVVAPFFDDATMRTHKQKRAKEVYRAALRFSKTKAGRTPITCTPEFLKAFEPLLARSATGMVIMPAWTWVSWLLYSTRAMPARGHGAFLEFDRRLNRAIVAHSLRFDTPTANYNFTMGTLRDEGKFPSSVIDHRHAQETIRSLYQLEYLAYVLAAYAHDVVGGTNRLGQQREGDC